MCHVRGKGKGRKVRRRRGGEIRERDEVKEGKRKKRKISERK